MYITKVQDKNYDVKNGLNKKSKTYIFFATNFFSPN